MQPPQVGRTVLSAIVLLAGWGAATPAMGDLIKLKNGGEVRGQLPRQIGIVGSEEVSIETLTGAVVVVRRDDLQFVTRRSSTLEEYETRARRIDDTIEAHRELAEWCRDNGLQNQRHEHLRQIIAIDPDHEEAHRGLGHSKHDGVWMTRDELMQSRGYVKHKGRYITPQELEILEKSQAELEAEREWYGKVRLWHGWLNGRHAERGSLGLAELQRIDVPEAVAALVHFLQDDDNPQIRYLLVEILSQIPGGKPVVPLVRQSLYDVESEIRFAALNAIPSQFYEQAMALYQRELKNGYNVIVRRAGKALERVGDERVVPALIDALVTTHRYRVRVPREDTITMFQTNSMVSGGQVVLPPELELMIRTGQFPYGAVIHHPPPPGQPSRPTKVITVKRDHQNAEVLAALRKLTGENFKYDQRTWRLWWSAHKAGGANLPE